MCRSGVATTVPIASPSINEPANKTPLRLSIKDSVLNSIPNSGKLSGIGLATVKMVDSTTIAASIARQAMNKNDMFLSVDEGEFYKRRRARVENNIAQSRLQKEKEVEENRSKKYANISSSNNAPSAAVVALSKKLASTKQPVHKYLEKREELRRVAMNKSKPTVVKKGRCDFIKTLFIYCF